MEQITENSKVEKKPKLLDQVRNVLYKIIKLKIEYGERELAQQVKSLGGSWDRQQKVWKLPFRYVQILKLEDRIVTSKNGG